MGSMEAVSLGGQGPSRQEHHANAWHLPVGRSWKRGPGDSPADLRDNAAAAGNSRGMRSVTVALGITASAGLLRVFAPDVASVVLASVPLGIGAGAGGVLLSMIVKSEFPARLASTATGFYTAGLQLGGALTAAVVVPMSGLLGGWRPAIASVAVGCAALLLVWLGVRRRSRIDPVSAAPSVVVSPATRRWLPATAAGFSLVILLFQGLNTWLPALMIERGWSAADAGAQLAALVFAQVPGTLLVGAIADRRGARWAYISVPATALVFAIALMAAVPQGAWAWAIVAGLAFGVMTPMILVIPVDFGADALAVGGSVAVILGFGYLAGSAGPFVMGMIRDATGSFEASLALLALLAIVLAVIGWTILRGVGTVIRPDRPSRVKV